MQPILVPKSGIDFVIFYILSEIQLLRNHYYKDFNTQASIFFIGILGPIQQQIYFCFNFHVEEELYFNFDVKDYVYLFFFLSFTYHYLLKLFSFKGFFKISGLNMANSIRVAQKMIPERNPWNLTKHVSKDECRCQTLPCEIVAHLDH